MKQGIDADVASMTQAQKTMLRYQYVMNNAKLSMGDFAKTANTWANVVKTLKQQFQALGGTIGTVFINAFKPALIALRNFMQHVLDFAKTVADALGAIFGWTIEVTASGSTIDEDLSSAVDSVGDLGSGAGNASDGLGSAADNAKKLAENLSVLPFDELNQLSKDSGGSGSGGSGGSGSGGSGGSGGGGGMSGNGAAAALVRTESVLEKITSSISSLEELGKYISDTLTHTLQGINWDSIYEGARNFGTGLAQFLNGLITPDLFGALGDTVAGAINTVLNATDAFADEFDFVNLGNSIATGINHFAAKTDLNLAAESFTKWANGILDAMTTAIGRVQWAGMATKISTAIEEHLDTETINSNFGQLLTAKFAAVGSFVGNINWDSLGTKVGNSIGSFFQTFKLETVGNTLATVANAIVSFVSSAASSANFSSIGSNIAKGISKIFSDFDFQKLGATVSGLATGILDFINSALINIKWIDVGKAIVDFIAGVNWGEVIAKAATAIAYLAGALVLVISGAVMEIGKKAEIAKVGVEIVTTICEAITKALSAVGSLPLIALDLIDGIFKGFADSAIEWASKINENIVTPFINGIKELFGIHSPSTVMAEIGGFLVEGLIKGLADNAKNFIQSIKDLFTLSPSDAETAVKNLLGGISTNVQIAVSKIKESIYNGLASFAEEHPVLADLLGLDAGTLRLKATAEIDKQEDLRKEQDKHLPNTADFTKATDGLSTGAKTISTWARYDAAKNGTLYAKGKEGWRTISTWAQYNASKMNLSAKQRTISAWAQYNASKNNLSKGQRTISTIADFYKRIIDFSTTVEMKARVYKLVAANGAIAGALGIKRGYNGGIFKPGKGFMPFQSFASGGYPYGGQIFRARENGNPELVGTLKGSTAVMNNNQIVASVSDGVAKAIAGIRFQMTGFRPPEIDVNGLQSVIEYAVVSALANNATERPIQNYVTVKMPNGEVLARAVDDGHRTLNYRSQAVAT